MRPVLFEIPYLGFKVLGFGTMMVFALLAALYIADRRARREKLNPELFADLGFFMIIGGVIGARLFFVLQHGESIRHFLDVFKFWQGGIVFYGGVVGGAVGFMIYRARRPFSLLPALDVIAPAVAAGIIFGRLGCFLNGCCYGDVCDLPWAVRFPAESSPWVHQVMLGMIPQSALRSLSIHPTQLYAALDGFVLLVLLTAYYPLRRRDGEVMALLLVTYPVTRFLIERLRDDEKAFLTGFTISQNISILIFLGGLAFWYYLSRLPVGRFVDRAGEPTELSPPIPADSLLPEGR